MEFYARTDKGRRRKMNQDYVFASDRAVGNFPNLFLLADGMGGHKAGDYASRYLVEGLRHYVEKAEPGPLVRVLENGIAALNGELYQLSLQHEELSGMGTTLVAAVVDEDGILNVANIGDSRAYLIRGNTIRQITRDHSYVEEMVEKGYMRRGSEDYLQSRNIITRAVGVQQRVHADFFELELSEGDFLLMCSDGLSNMADNESILNVVQDASSVQAKVEALIDLANLNGGRDNIGVILLDPFGKEVQV
jgi:PPM family protein phosphatase